jgi:hypothetical protein
MGIVTQTLVTNCMQEVTCHMCAAGRGERLEHYVLVLSADGFSPGAPDGPHLLAQFLGS